MRIQALIALAAGLAVLAAVPADAASSKKKKRYENRAHFSITVRKHRSFLDAGTEVRPGEKGYHDYYYLLTSRYPEYGPVNDNLNSRWPLPSRFELPGY